MTSPANLNDDQAHLLQRIDELEIRAVYLEETVESLNQQLSHLTQEFILAKQAMRLLNQRIEQMHQQDSKDFTEESPPPHY